MMNASLTGTPDRTSRTLYLVKVVAVLSCAISQLVHGAGDEATPDYIRQLQTWDVANVPRPAQVDSVAFFGLKGKVTIRKADELLDGGTLRVDVQDERGVSLHLVAVAHLFEPKRGPREVSISFPGRIKGSYLMSENGGARKALIALLQLAAAQTFGPENEAGRRPFNGTAAVVRRLIDLLASPAPR